MAAFKLEIQTKKSGKCASCGEAFEPSDLALGSAALYSEEDEIYGSTYWRHTYCAEKRQVQWLSEKYSKIKGWDGLSTEDQESVQEKFETILKSEGKKKKKQAKGKSSKKRKSGKATDEDDTTDDDAKKGKKKKKDVNAPKKNKTSYMLFCEQNRPEFKKENPNATGKELTTLLSEAWKALSDEEKKSWTESAKKDKERYERQLKEYESTGKFSEKEDDSEKGNDENDDKPKKKKLRKIAEEGEKEETNNEEENKESEKSEDNDAPQQSENGKKEDKEEGDKEEGEKPKESPKKETNTEES